MITVIAGVNGAGKSSVFGTHIRSIGGEYFNPDEATREILANEPNLSEDEANSQAWQLNYDRLELAIDTDTDYIFETTLGGDSICNKLHVAIDKGITVNIMYCGLASPELHVERVAARVAKGGHHIPENTIRKRYQNSLHNMLGLAKRCNMVRVVDNSGSVNEIKILLAFEKGQITEPPIVNMPEWAKPLAVVLMERAITPNS